MWISHKLFVGHWKNTKALFWYYSLYHGFLGGVGEGKSLLFGGLVAALGGTGRGSLGRVVQGKWLYFWSGCQHMVHLANIADMTGVGQETKPWLWLGVEGSLWYPWVLPKKAGKTLERHGTELTLQLYSRPNLISLIRYMYIYLNLWRKRKVWGVGDMCGKRDGVTIYCESWNVSPMDKGGLLYSIPGQEWFNNGSWSIRWIWSRGELRD